MPHLVERRWLWHNSRYYSSICLGGLKKNLNPGPPIDRATVLFTPLRHSGIPCLGCDTVKSGRSSQYIKGTCCLYLQNGRVRVPEDVVSRFLWNIGDIYQITWRHISEHCNVQLLPQMMSQTVSYFSGASALQKPNVTVKWVALLVCIQETQRQITAWRPANMKDVFQGFP
jgi:hypothetical protein